MLTSSKLALTSFLLALGLFVYSVSVGTDVANDPLWLSVLLDVLAFSAFLLGLAAMIVRPIEFFATWPSRVVAYLFEFAFPITFFLLPSIGRDPRSPSRSEPDGPWRRPQPGSFDKTG
ncbi:hypothetical protein Mal64_19070 [Pseudobythopirellula maris]|uniref:Uncharacterized protein n=1 Tax=Pseudobythopirellula maris TaxID=2527991 RepID=A0A5C5ZMV2_9BACT|nr:hypothetical protein [Pseudobythopirellula maris]TWT88426.1 hypothetical protein Mal64_19070 [Pseudobythopirellula maris]